MKNVTMREVALFLLLCIISFAFLLSVESCEEPAVKEAVQEIKAISHTRRGNHATSRPVAMVQESN
ncbi:hypothetical protein DJ568_07605 [Mucilaginibacter hurinus]|uniref:Uncharacterized protein n=1 Tax=Mucilaginibacter hurinus TaxID=2201324 RepID=A0A367GSK1_9SPHI|nr:hypothetical protein [Mucilaginibacter hurinus]RCH55741.1 hypothetical protein DJ568_07605 [Mucilaginibacter hurinus]